MLPIIEMHVFNAGKCRNFAKFIVSQLFNQGPKIKIYSVFFFDAMLRFSKFKLLENVAIQKVSYFNVYKTFCKVNTIYLKTVLDLYTYVIGHVIIRG